MEVDIKKVAVLGSGTMGQGIAQTLATGGFTVHLRDVDQGLLDRAIAKTTQSLDRFFVQKGKMTEAEAAGHLDRILTYVDMAEAVSDADFVIEAIPEDIELKKKTFAELDRLCPSHTILASNTSVMSVTAIAGATRRPDRVIGMHFLNPVALMKLVEVVCPLGVADETVDAAFYVAGRMGKEPIRTKDTPGFIVNRLLVAVYNTGAQLVLDGVASAEDVDKALRLGANWPMGPCELADFGGLDIVLDASEGIAHYTENPKDATCLLYKKMVEAGRLGRKNGRGFYDYDDQGGKTPAKLL
jgi:3-hydroxybutyryl-CoA dehydrogenase